MRKKKPRMQIEAQRSLLIDELKEIKDLSILVAVRDYLRQKMAAEEGIDIEQYNREIDEAVKRMDAGHFVTHEDALKRLSKWRKKEK